MERLDQTDGLLIHCIMANKELINQLHQSEPRWFAVKTRPKSEKMVQRLLTKKKIAAYVPLQRLYRRYQRSTRLAEIPLIHGYVFVRIVQAEYLAVLETEHVSGFIQFNKNLIAIPDWEIDLLRRVTLEEGLNLEALPRQFATGDPVEICAGNLTGLRGRIIKVDGQRRFQVELERLGYSLLLTIDAVFLEKTNLALHPEPY